MRRHVAQAASALQQLRGIWVLSNPDSRPRSLLTCRQLSLPDLAPLLPGFNCSGHSAHESKRLHGCRVIVYWQLWLDDDCPGDTCSAVQAADSSCTGDGANHSPTDHQFVLDAFSKPAETPLVVGGIQQECIVVAATYPVWHIAMPSFLIGSLSPRESALVGSIIVAFLQQWIGWGISAPLQTDKTYDFFGSAGFIVLAIGTFTYGHYYHARQILVTLAVLLWALRLGGFLVLRVIKTGGDSRFDDAKHKPGKYLVFWTLQAVWVWTVSLPLIVLNTTQHNPDLWASDIIGAIIWITGFVCESTADIQKFVWKNNPANKGKFITSGLWRWSRHPNYFGEILMWWGIWLMTICVLDKGYWLTVASPLFTMALLLFVSGIPIQEKQAQKRWGADPAYQRYKRHSRLLVPVPRLCPKDPPGDQEKIEAGDHSDFRDQD